MMNSPSHSDEQDPKADHPEAEPAAPESAAQAAPGDTQPADANPTEEAEARSLQDQEIQEAVTKNYALLQVCSTDPVLQPLLAQYGLDVPALESGGLLVQKTAAAFNVRYTTMGNKKSAQRDLTKEATEARTEYACFRDIVRPMFPLVEDRTTLALRGDVPEDLESFITLAQASYENGKADAYTERLSARSYTPARLDELKSALDVLVAHSGARTKSKARATASTADRNAAFAAMSSFMRELKGVLKAILRKSPHLRTLVEK